MVLSRTQFTALLIAGALVRAVALPGPGTGDLTVWKVWSYNAARQGIGGMYGVGGTPIERREREPAAARPSVDYPPRALSEVGAPRHLTGSGSGSRSPTARSHTALV